MALNANTPPPPTTPARQRILSALMEDHRRVKKVYRQFQKLDLSRQPGECEALVNLVLAELTMHAAIEEELIYPAARLAMDDESLIDEAEVEHETVHGLMDQLRVMNPEDAKYAARFTVLCEFVQHHVKEEEKQLFPQLARMHLDWEGLAIEVDKLREELMEDVRAAMADTEAA